jgi:hypothetical protein
MPTLPTLLSILLLFPSAFSSSLRDASGSRSRQLSAREVPSFEESSNDAGSLLEKLAEQYRIPVGFEAVPSSSPTTTVKTRTPLRIRLRASTVGEVLTAITTADPRYVWSEGEGAINVAPRKRTASLLDVMVGRFDVKDVSRTEARSALLSLPEVKTWMLQREVSERTFVTFPAASNNSALLSLSLANVSVRYILNAILKAGGSHFWSYLQYELDQRQFLSLSIDNP